MRNIPTTHILMITICQLGDSLPSNAQRNPSITPAMGLRAYTVWNRSGTMDEGYRTGEENIHNWVKRGTTEATSRYFTFIADSQMLTDREVATVMQTNKGRAMIAHVGHT